MTLEDFNDNPLDEQVHLVLLMGQQLWSREEGACDIGLYHMDRFFAEVWCSQNNSRILKIRGFKSASFLDPYLEKIELGNLKK